MTLKQKYWFVLLLIFSCHFSFAQITPTQKDTAKMYRNIETYSKKRKFTQYIHGLIFQPLTKKNTKVKKKVLRKRFRTFQGKIIRRIDIVTLDPFGYSETDTTAKPTRELSNLGNRLHLKSKRLTILNLILIKRNKPFDSLLVKESERLIRSQRFVRRVAITSQLVSKNSDSVDVYIRVLDSWSTIPDFSVSGTKANYQLTERNFMGFGHQLENSYKTNMSNNEDAYSVRYTIPNVMNTYIKTEVNYQMNLDNSYTKGINIERPFFSPFARWAGGAFFEQQFRFDSLPDLNNVYAKQNFKKSTNDFWAGHAYPIFKGESEDARTTNLITTARLERMSYQESPEYAYDSINFYSHERSYLFGIGVSSRQFIEDKFLFNYGIIEDVPVGRAFGITGGFQKKNGIGRMYLGTRIALGNYYKWGYLSSNIEYGSYFNKGTSEQSAFSFQTNYFTNLVEVGRWKFRQFIKTQAIIGNDRQASNGDRLTLNENDGIQGFNARRFFGTKKMLLTFQAQSYSPWNTLGFRLNPFLSYSMGMLGNAESSFNRSKLYSQIGVGLIISNDYLVFSNFQLSFSFYPSIPESDNNIFKTNSFNTEDFGFQDFEIAKPRTVIYQ